VNRTLRTITASLGTVLGAGLVGWSLWGAELTRCHVIEVTGNERATAAEVRHLADIALGSPLVGVDLVAAAGGAERHPWVAHAEVRRAFPDRVVIDVRERVPTALLLLDDLYVVDAEGNPFRKAVGVSLDLPVITGIPLSFADEQPDLARRIIRDALDILAQGADEGGAAAGNITRNAVSEVRFDRRAGYMVIQRNGGEVLLGFEPKAALGRLARLSREGVDLSTPHRVDLGSPRLAVVTPL